MRVLMIGVALVVTSLFSPLIPENAFAAGLDPFGDVCRDNPTSAVCQDRRPNPNEGFYNFLQTIINTILLVLGSVAVIMIIVGAIKFVVSGGDQSAITGARDTIIYAVIGLVVAIMSYGIANFIINALKSVPA